MKKFLYLSLVIFLTFSFTPVFPKETSNGKATENLANIAKDVSENSRVIEVSDSIVGNIQRAIDEYAKERGINFNEPVGGKFFAYSIQLVNRSPDSPFFGEARISVFERAWLDVQRKIASYLGQSIASETCRKLFRNDSEGAENIKLSNWDIIKSKIAGLTDAALNKALEKLGVDPSKFGNLTIEKKKNLLFDLTVKEVIRRTYAELPGTVVIQTFEGENNGNYAVGVVAMYSPKLKELTKLILKNKFPTSEGK